MTNQRQTRDHDAHPTALPPAASCSDGDTGSADFFVAGKQDVGDKQRVKTHQLNVHRPSISHW